jgi:hypothetical protein
LATSALAAALSSTLLTATGLLAALGAGEPALLVALLHLGGVPPAALPSLLGRPLLVTTLSALLSAALTALLLLSSTALLAAALLASLLSLSALLSLSSALVALIHSW